MNISGIIVMTTPQKQQQVKQDLLAFPGVEIPIDNGDGRMVVIIDEANAKASGEVLMKIQTLEGVLSANLVYQHVEDEDQGDKPSPETINDAENLQ